MRSENQNTRRVGLIASLIVGAATVLMVSAAEAAPLGRELVELESHIKWSAVDEAWKQIRPRWVVMTSACDTSECVARQLLELEAHVKWKAVEAAWTKKRNGWVRDCKDATTEGELANLLLDFEQNVRWQAVDEEWKARRTGWVTRVKGG